MANNEEKPATAAELAARLAQARQDTVDSVARPLETPVFRTDEAGAVLLRDGRKLKEQS